MVFGAVAVVVLLACLGALAWGQARRRGARASSRERAEALEAYARDVEGDR